MVKDKHTNNGIKGEKIKSEMMRVHLDFKKIVDDCILLYLEKMDLNISTTQATKIISNKIKKMGGIKKIP